MAHGERFALAIPVLASIYRVLKEISTSANLSASEIIFPIQYVYGWIGEYFDTYYRARHYNGARMCKIAGERMAKNFDLSGAKRLFQDVDICKLPNLSMLQSKELFIADNGELSSSWNNYIISLCSSYVTVRCDDHLVMELYSPHRFTRQFGFVQDLPGNFIKRPYDGTLKELAQLWDSCTLRSSSSTISVPPRPDRPLMTRRYSDWWSNSRTNLVGQNKIILKVPSRLPDQKKSSSSSLIKSKASPLPSKSSTSKGMLVKTGKGSRTTSSKSSITPSMASNNTRKRKVNSTSLENNSGQMPTKVLIKGKTSTILLADEVVDGNGGTSSTKGEVDQDHHWKRNKRKVKDQRSAFADLDAAIIDNETFFVDDPSSTMPLPELAEQLGLKDAAADTFSGIFYGVTSPSCLDISSPPLTEALKNKIEVAAAQIKSPKVHVPSLPFAAPNFEPQETISTFKKSYILQMCGALHEWLTIFSVDSSDNFLKLKKGVNMIMEELKEINAINTSILEDSVKTFLKMYEEYDAIKLSSSQKMT